VGCTLILLIQAGTGLSGHTGQRRIDPKTGCRTNPEIVSACFTIHARVFMSNGTPSIRMWPVGTKRILGVLPSEAEIMPDVVRRNVNWTTRVYGDYEVCPFTPEKVGEMRFVCIESASNLIGERLAEGRTEPIVFRIK
jgi:hypothetical protein